MGGCWAGNELANRPLKPLGHLSASVVSITYPTYRHVSTLKGKRQLHKPLYRPLALTRLGARVHRSKAAGCAPAGLINIPKRIDDLGIGIRRNRSAELINQLVE